MNFLEKTRQGSGDPGDCALT